MQAKEQQPGDQDGAQKGNLASGDTGEKTSGACQSLDLIVRGGNVLIGFFIGLDDFQFSVSLNKLESSFFVIFNLVFGKVIACPLFDTIFIGPFSILSMVGDQPSNLGLLVEIISD